MSKNKGIRPGKAKISVKSRTVEGQRNIEYQDYKDYDDRQIPEPQLFWPVYEFDSDDYSYNESDKIVFSEIIDFIGFEDYKNSIDRVINWEKNRNSRLLRINSLFLKEVIQCDTVYIVDKYFDVEEFDRIMHVLQNANGCPLRQLYIICDSNYDAIRRRIAENETNGFIVNVEITVSSMKNAGKRYFEIHDRFALLDEEIWHFGWTVCGVGHTLNAYSRGWNDRNGKFKDYLNKIVRP